MKILFVKLGALGDVINTLPLAILLKEKLNAEISWLVAPLSYPLLANHPDVDQVICFDKSEFLRNAIDCIRKLRRQNFDIALDLQRTIKSALFTSLSAAKLKIGFDYHRCKDATWIFPFERIEKGDSSKHMLEQYMDFAVHLGIPAMTDPLWKIAIPRKTSLLLPDRYIVLNIGASKKANLWPGNRFVELANMLAQQKLNCVLTGGPEDIERAGLIESQVDSSLINLVGQTTIEDLIDVLSAAETVVSCDTGPMHLAVALGSRTVALFGPANPQRTGPYTGTVIRENMDCINPGTGNCSNRSCKTGDCMKEIKAQTVFEHIQQGQRK
jgi:lipopolysaccharide heptosyltransferase II